MISAPGRSSPRADSTWWFSCKTRVTVPGRDGGVAKSLFTASEFSARGNVDRVPYWHLYDSYLPIWIPNVSAELWKLHKYHFGGSPFFLSSAEDLNESSCFMLTPRWASPRSFCGEQLLTITATSWRLERTEVSVAWPQGSLLSSDMLEVLSFKGINIQRDDSKMVSPVNRIMRESRYKKPRMVAQMEYNEIKKGKCKIPGFRSKNLKPVQE